MIKAIIFDCFGVLYPHWLGKLDKELTQAEYEQLHDVVHKVNNAELTQADYENKLQQITGLSIQQLEEKYGQGMPPNRELLELTAELRPEYEIGLLSNVHRTYLDRLFSRDNLYSYFDEMVISSDIGVSKPALDAYQAILDKLGVKPSEAIFFDDSSKNVKGAKQLGIKAYEYKSFAHVKSVLDQELNH